MRSPGNALRYSLWLLFAVSLAVACFPPIWNIDLFWHIAAGDWIRLHRTIPNTDIFSAVAPDRAWIPFQWLFEVGVSFLEDAGGLLSVRIAGWLLLMMSATVGAVYWRRLLPNPWAPLLLTVLLFILFGDRIRFRPHLFNLFFTMIALPLLLHPEKLSIRVRLLLIAGLVPLWANIHAGGAMIFLVLLSLPFPPVPSLSPYSMSGKEGPLRIPHWQNGKRTDSLLESPCSWRYRCPILRTGLSIPSQCWALRKV